MMHWDRGWQLDIQSVVGQDACSSAIWLLSVIPKGHCSSLQVPAKCVRGFINHALPELQLSGLPHSQWQKLLSEEQKVFFSWSSDWLVEREFGGGPCGFVTLIPASGWPLDLEQPSLMNQLGWVMLWKRVSICNQRSLHVCTSSQQSN